MPDRRQNRGAHPQDARCFAAETLPTLRRATAELAWLLDRGYSEKAAATLVGDRHALRARQRAAVLRCALGEAAATERETRRRAPASIKGAEVLIDGYNVLLTVEAALAGAVVLCGRDGNLRDLAAMSSHYRRVHQTRPAITHIGVWLAEHGAAKASWYLDAPVSNSGRLAGWILEVAADHGWPWQAELVASPDRVLARSERLIATADSGILARGGPWLALARHVVEARVPGAWLVDLAGERKAPVQGRTGALPRRCGAAE